MKKLLTSLVAGGLMAGATISLAAPSVEEVNADIQEFQGFFAKRFPEVSLEEYKDGVNALPVYAHRRANWELLMEFPPYEEFLDRGLAAWEAPLKDGSTLAQCVEGKPAGNQYPYMGEDGKVNTIEMDVIDCLVAAGEEKPKYTSPKLAELTMAYKSQANGEPVDIDYSSEAMREVYAKGREFYWTKRGQLNMACADCHVHNAGNRVRGDVLSAGLGHTTGFPVYRTKWAVANEKKAVGSIQRRYKGCNNNLRASAFKPGGPEYTALEVYETIMSSGVPLRVPAQRQ